MAQHFEGEKCPSCGAVWRHREGDGGKNGPLSCYHRSNCELVMPQRGTTEERARNMTSEEKLILDVRKIVEAKHSDDGKPGFQHNFDPGCPACTVKARIKGALVDYDETTDYKSFKVS